MFIQIFRNHLWKKIKENLIEKNENVFDNCRVIKKKVSKKMIYTNTDECELTVHGFDIYIELNEQFKTINIKSNDLIFPRGLVRL